MPNDALEKQVGGSHYKNLAIQPAEYCQRNRLSYCESSVIQYVTRHREKNGRQDIEKAIHCLELLLAIEYPPQPEEEVVLCVSRKAFARMPQGLDTDIVTALVSVIGTPSNVVYVARSKAEEDANLKQLIPYVIIVCGNKVLRYRRGKRGGESRLHGKLSIGIGGHINEKSDSASMAYNNGMMRELDEELGGYREPGQPCLPPMMVAVLNDDSDPVGSVHLGIVHVLRVWSEDIIAKCTSIVDPEFVAFEQAVADADQCENWSKLCLARLGNLLAKGQYRYWRMEYNTGDRVELTEDGKAQFAADTYIGPYANQQGTVVGTEDPGDDSILHVRFDDGNVAEFGKGVITKVVAP